MQESTSNTVSNSQPDTAAQIMVSIPIINWNTRQMLDDCLQSVFDNLGDFPAEVIVVDNASEDQSADMVADKYPQCVLIRNDENVGFAAANNQAMEISKGKHVLLLNSDTLVHGDVIQKSVDYLEAQPDVGAMGCRVLNTDGSVQLTCSQFPTLLNVLLSTTGLWKLSWPKFFGRFQMTHWQRDTERDVEVVSGCYLLVRQSVIDQVGVLDDDFFFFGEETDWCKRIVTAGWKLRFSPVGEITHHGSVSAKKLNFKRDVMLSGAKVRLHHKHGGILPAALCWTMLLTFNSSRLAYWTLHSLLTSKSSSRERASHFRGVVTHFFDTWQLSRSRQ